MSSCFSRIASSEDGAATIIEYTIVLPIVMAIIMFLMFTGYLIYDKATMEAATERTALYVSKVVADPNYPNITTRSSSSNEVDEIAITSGSIKTHPYRYLFGKSVDTDVAAGTARAMIIENQLMRNDSVNVTVNVSGSVFRKVTVRATEEFRMPNFLSTLNMPPLITLKTECTMYVNEPAELIRNADFAIDILRKLGVGEAIASKLAEIKSGISFFDGNTK